MLTPLVTDAARTSVAVDPVVRPQAPPAGPLRIGLDLTPAEAERLVAERMLRYCLTDLALPAGQQLDRSLRATCIAALLEAERLDPRAWVVGVEAALWVHAGPGADADEKVAEAVGDDADPRSVPPRPPAEPDQVVVFGERGSSDRYGRRVVRRQAFLPPGHVSALGPLLITTPARTAADLLRRVPAAEGWWVLERLSACSSLSAEDVAAVLHEHSGARGVVTARRSLRRWCERVNDRPTVRRGGR